MRDNMIATDTCSLDWKLLVFEPSFVVVPQIEITPTKNSEYNVVGEADPWKMTLGYPSD